MDAIRFNQRMYGLSSRVVDNANQIVKDVANKFVETVAKQTPIDTGRAVSNWRVGLNYEPRGVVDPHAPGKAGSTSSANISATIAAASSTINGRQTGQTIFVANNAPYIDRLNQGWSAQAPAGFVDQAREVANATIRSARLLRGL